MDETRLCMHILAAKLHFRDTFWLHIKALSWKRIKNTTCLNLSLVQPNVFLTKYWLWHLNVWTKSCFNTKIFGEKYFFTRSLKNSLALNSNDRAKIFLQTQNGVTKVYFVSNPKCLNKSLASTPLWIMKNVAMNPRY